jgi:hypothetical protein
MGRLTWLHTALVSNFIVQDEVSNMSVTTGRWMQFLYHHTVPCKCGQPTVASSMRTLFGDPVEIFLIEMDFNQHQIGTMINICRHHARLLYLSIRICMYSFVIER